MSHHRKPRLRNPYHRETTVTVVSLTDAPLFFSSTTEEPRQQQPFHDEQQLDDEEPSRSAKKTHVQDPPLSGPNLNQNTEHSSQSDPGMPAQTQTQVPSQSDLEVLQNLKEMIKAGQHEFYRAVPQPQALAAIYLGPNAQVSPDISLDLVFPPLDACSANVDFLGSLSMSSPVGHSQG